MSTPRAKKSHDTCTLSRARALARAPARRCCHAWQAEKTTPARMASGKATAQPATPARTASTNTTARTATPCPLWQGETQVRSLQPLPAWQGKVRLQGVQSRSHGPVPPPRSSGARGRGLFLVLATSKSFPRRRRFRFARFAPPEGRPKGVGVVDRSRPRFALFSRRRRRQARVSPSGEAKAARTAGTRRWKILARNAFTAIARLARPPNPRRDNPLRPALRKGLYTQTPSATTNASSGFASLSRTSSFDAFREHVDATRHFTLRRHVFGLRGP